MRVLFAVKNNIVVKYSQINSNTVSNPIPLDAFTRMIESLNGFFFNPASNSFVSNNWLGKSPLSQTS